MFSLASHDRTSVDNHGLRLWTSSSSHRVPWLAVVTGQSRKQASEFPWESHDGYNVPNQVHSKPERSATKFQSHYGGGIAEYFEFRGVGHHC